MQVQWTKADSELDSLLTNSKEDPYSAVKMSSARYGIVSRYGAVNADENDARIAPVAPLPLFSKDAEILIACKCVRMFGFGFLSVMLALYLSKLTFTAEKIGLMFTLTLLGDAVISLGITTHADVFGRRKMLLIGALLAILTTAIFITESNFWILTIAAVVGVITPSGNEIGPFMAIELSSLSQVTADTSRTHLMAWYTLAGCLSSAVGALVCGFTLYFCQSADPALAELTAYRLVLLMYLGTQIVLSALFYNLSENIEVPPAIEARVGDMSNPVGVFLGLHKSKLLVLKLSALFMLDSFAGSFVLQTIISAWFYHTYGTSPAKLGGLVFVCNIVAGVSALFAAQLADKIGLINTMVVTHVPSNILLILVPLMPNETSAIIVLCLRYSISQMDVPTRNAYVQGVVDPDERSAANGITNVVRSIGAATGPYLAGLLYHSAFYTNYPWYIAGGLKIVYDLLLLYSMQQVKPVEEVEKAHKDELQRLNSAHSTNTTTSSLQGGDSQETLDNAV